MPGKKKKQADERKDDKFAHNPRYCMILPDAADPDEEDISTPGQS